MVYKNQIFLDFFFTFSGIASYIASKSSAAESISVYLFDPTEPVFKLDIQPLTSDPNCEHGLEELQASLLTFIAIFYKYVI